VYVLVHLSSVNCTTSNDKGSLQYSALFTSEVPCILLAFQEHIHTCLSSTPIQRNDSSVHYHTQNVSDIYIFSSQWKNIRRKTCNRSQNISSEFAYRHRDLKKFHLTSKCTFSINTHSLFNSKREMSNSQHSINKMHNAILQH